MGTAEVVALILQGGAVAVLTLWVLDLRQQRREERAERIANGEIMRSVSSSLGALTSAIEDLIDGRSTRPPRTRR